MGAASPLELTSAQAAQARQREEVILARLAYRKAGDRLFYRIHPRGQARDADLRLIPSTEPDLSGGMPPVPDARAAIRKALAQRPELGLEDARIERAEVGVLESANRRRPELNVFGRYEYGGLNDSFGNSMDNVVNTEFPEWQAGVSLEFLFDGRARLARWRQAAIERTSAELGRQRAEARVALETRAALFDLEAAIQAVEAAALTLKLAREQYEGERDRLAVGASTVFRVDAYRRDLLDAERQHLNARIAVFLAQAVLEAAQGQFARAIVASAAHVEGD